MQSEWFSGLGTPFSNFSLATIARMIIITSVFSISGIWIHSLAFCADSESLIELSRLHELAIDLSESARLKV